MRKYIAIIIASLALFTGQAHAQRCLPKMQGIEVRANLADGFKPGGNDGGYSFGAALSTYTKKGNKWVFGGEYLLKNNPYKDGKIPWRSSRRRAATTSRYSPIPVKSCSSMQELRLLPDMNR